MREFSPLTTRRRVLLLGAALAVVSTAAAGLALRTGNDTADPDPTRSSSGSTFPSGRTTAFPSEQTVGVPAGTTLTQSGGMTITKAGTVIDGYDIDGVVLVQADDVVIRNSRIRGTGWWSIEVDEGMTGVVVEHCDIDGQGEHGFKNSMAVMGPATVRRNDISGVENGVTPGSGSLIEGNYIHDLLAPGDPHYDGIQIDGNVSDIVIRNNTIIVDHNQTSAVMIANDQGPATNITVTDNYLAGGAYTVYSDGQFDGGPISGVRFLGNTLERGHWGYASIENNAPEISGNIDAETGRIVPLTDGH